MESMRRSADRLCDVCCSLNTIFTTNDRLYGRLVGEWPVILFCEDCYAAVRCHKDTVEPLGKMASKKTRQLRNKAHKAFDPLWRNGYMTRDNAYRWLAAQVNYADVDNCHLSELTDKQLKQAITICQAFIAANPIALIKRRKKQRERAFERNEREHKLYSWKRANRRKSR